jgi:glucose/arabinose dehydrogenase
MLDRTQEAAMQRPVSRALVSSLLLVAACVDDPRQGTPTTAPNVPSASVAAANPTTANNIGPSALGWSLPIGVQLVASGLTSPVQLVQPPGNATRFIVDQIGLVRMLTPGGALLPQPFLDVSSRITPLSPGYDERGLLGLAFHPSFQTNGRFYVFYTIPPRAGAPAGFNHTNVISEFRATVPANANDAPVLVPGSERVLLQVDHPQGNHNGGTVAFGPDGYLYISIGDGGNRDDEGLGHVEDWYAGNAGGNGQDITSNLLGNILRIDVDGAMPYAVPADNPFVGKPGRDEIWAYGFRNPYRFAFDPGGSHMLLVGDAGQELWEEVSQVVKGGNYGWNVKEGTHCFDAETDGMTVPATCPTVDPTTGEPLRNPVIEFANWKNQMVPERLRLSLTVVGGHVYRGSAIPWLVGRYIFGGAATPPGGPGGRLFVATSMTPQLWPISELLVNGRGRLDHVVKGFGQDNAGEVYVAASEVLGPSGTTGKVFKLVPPAP